MESVECSEPSLLYLWLLETCRGKQEGVREEIPLICMVYFSVAREVVDGKDTGLFYFENMVLIHLTVWEIKLRKS